MERMVTIIYCFALIISAETANSRGLFGGALKDFGDAIGGDIGGAISRTGTEGDKEMKKIKKPVEKAIKEVNNALSDLETAARTGKCGGDICDALEQAKKDSARLLKEIEKGACMNVYQYITQPVVAHCANYGGRMDNPKLIEDTKALLVSKGYFKKGDFADVQIRWCPLLKSVSGMVPDRNKLLLNVNYMSDNPKELAPLLAHEMVHIKQYIRKGTNNFKCQYSELFLKCGGCQNNSHPFEKEAYELEKKVKREI